MSDKVVGRSKEGVTKELELASDDHFRSLFEHATIGMALVHPQGTFLDVNPAFCEMLGFEHDELLERSFKDITHPEDLGKDLEHYKRLLAGDITSYTYEKRYIHKDGHSLWGLLSASIIFEAGKVKYAVGQITNIDALKRSELELSASELRFKTSFDLSAAGMALLDTQGRWLQVNRAFCDMLGYLEHELKSLQFSDITHPDDVATDLAFLDEQLHGGLNSFKLEKRYRHKAGHYVWTIVSVSTVRTPTGEPGYFINQIVNISERKIAEAALRESQDRYRFLNEATLEGIAVSHNGVIIDVNESLCHIFRRDDLVGADVSEMVDPKDIGRVMAHIQQGFDESYECLCRRGDDTTFVAEVHGKPALYNGEEVRITVVRDVTSYKRIETALKEGEARYRTILNTVSEGILLQQADGSLVANAQAESLLGLSLNESTEPDTRHLKILNESGEPLENDALPSTITLQTGQAQHNVVLGVQKYGKATTWLRVNTNPLSDAEGATSGVVASFSDITETRQVHELLKERAKELERSNRDLQDFAHIASHDLQEPLRMVSSYVQLLAKRYGDVLDEDARDYIGFAVDGAKRMKKLIQDLLEYSRFSSQTGICKTLASKDVLQSSLDNLQVRLADTQAQLSYDPLPEICGDRAGLERLFQNLIANALKFCTHTPHIHISVQEQPQFWRFGVQDNGIGVAKDELERIFDPFQRLNTRADFAGNGVGLAICRRIVEYHGGQIWAESDGRTGTTFYFTLSKSAKERP